MIFKAIAVMQVIIAMTFLFQILVQVNAEFAVQPLSVVQASGLKAEFECHNPGAALYVWRINGVLYEDEQFPADFTRIPPSTSFPEARLIIPSTSQYNNTVVQCEAFVPEGGVFVSVSSNNATLIVQDIRLRNIETTEGSTTVSWDNPFTTNLMFCVDAVSVVSSETLASVCVSGTQYTFTSLDTDLCEEVSFTVTPTDGEKNGTPSQPEIGYLWGSRDIMFVRCQEAQCEAVLTTPLSCEAELTFDTTDGLSPLVSTTTISGNGGTTYTLDSAVEANRHYSVNLTITTSSGTRYSLPSQHISTHDITKASARPSSTEGALSTNCTFVANTTARGYLTIVSSDSSIDPVFSAWYNTAGTEDTIKGVGRGQYRAIFFDLESLPDHLRTDCVLIGSAFSVTGVDIPMGRRTQHSIESDNHLKEANVKRNDISTANIRCSSVMDCLILMYDSKSTTLEVLITLFVMASEERSVSVKPEERYSVAFFAINSSSMSLADRLPGRVISLDLVTTSNATFPLSPDYIPTSNGGVAFFSRPSSSFAFGTTAIVLWLLIVCGGLPS